MGLTVNQTYPVVDILTDVDPDDNYAVLGTEPDVTVSLRDVLDNNRSFPAKMKRRKLFGRYGCVYVIRRGIEVLYVGQTAYDIRTRMQWHKNNNSPLGIVLRHDSEELFDCRADLFWSRPKAARLELERSLIECLSPKLNHRREAA